MNRRTLLGLLALGAGTAVVGQLLPSAPPTPDRTTTPQRLLSLSPSITETIFTLGAEARLIGRSDYCIDPPAAGALPSFGTGLAPQLEAIAAAQPDLIILDGSLANPLDKLQAVGTVEVLPWLDLDEVVGSIRKLGDLLDRTEQAQALAQSIKSALQPTASADAPRLLAIMSGSDLSKGPMWYLRPDSLHGAAITAAGFRNAYDDATQGPPSLSIEALLKLDPDLIIVVNQGVLAPADLTQMQHALDHLSPLQAVHQGRVGVVHGENLLGNGPGIIRFVEQLRSTGQALLETE